MLDIILNEKDVAEQFKNGVLPEHIKISEVIKIIIKHYYIEKMDKDEMYKKILLDLKNVLKDDFVYTKWCKTIKYMVNKFFKDVSKFNLEVKLNNIANIKISKTEINKIIKLDDAKLEKLAFVLLVYGKIANIQMNSNKGWINKTYTSIFKEAKITANNKEKSLMLNTLYQKKYIDISNINTKTNIKICFIDNLSEEIVIKDFSGVVYNYLNYIGEDWKQCEGKNCEKWIKVKSNRSKYCRKCAATNEKENVKKRVEKHRKANM